MLVQVTKHFLFKNSVLEEFFTFKLAMVICLEILALKWLDRFRNVPYDWINKKKSDQHWLKKEGEKFLFPGGGTMFHNGVKFYVDLMQDLIPEMKNGTIRTAIDTGCGVSFAY